MTSYILNIYRPYLSCWTQRAVLDIVKLERGHVDSYGI